MTCHSTSSSTPRENLCVFGSQLASQLGHHCDINPIETTFLEAYTGSLGLCSKNWLEYSDHQVVNFTIIKTTSNNFELHRTTSNNIEWPP